MRATRPHAVWLDIPRRAFLRAKFTVDGDVHLMVGDPNDEVNVVFERTALTRLVEVACELLAVPAPTGRTSPIELSGAGFRGTGPTARSSRK